jgi:hypothetical protein
VIYILNQVQDGTTTDIRHTYIQPEKKTPTLKLKMERSRKIYTRTPALSHRRDAISKEEEQQNPRSLQFRRLQFGSPDHAKVRYNSSRIS